MKILITLSLLAFIFSSCLIKFINDNYYKELHPDDKKYIYKLTSFDNLENRRIYEINGLQLKEELAKYDSSLVYLYAHNCNGPTCYPLAAFENYAERKNLKLFLVMNSYFSLDKTFIQHFESPLFAIDTDDYGSIKQKDYLRGFLKDLDFFRLESELKLMSKMIFHKDSLVGFINDIK